MTSFTWLHLTDLHQGLPGQQWLWPAVKEAFFTDLQVLHEKTGPLDMVLFTGDLSQKGSTEEFLRLSETFDQIWSFLSRLGSKPALVTVPGNHDLVRPGRSGRPVPPALRALSQWHTDASLRADFWATDDNDYRTLVSQAFEPYEKFCTTRPVPPHFVVKRGLLPGDISVSLKKDGVMIVIVGLNTAFLQLTGEEYLGRLELDPRQFSAVSSTGDPIEWVGHHHIALLLTHHPTTWLHERARKAFFENIAPSGLFFSHLFGHMHEGTTITESIAGSQFRRTIQGPSLFGLETWGDGQIQRIHGYMAARIDLVDRQGTFRLWPRTSIKTHSGGRQIAPDYQFYLDSDGAVIQDFEIRQPLSVTMSTALNSHGTGVRREVGVVPQLPTADEHTRHFMPYSSAHSNIMVPAGSSPIVNEISPFTLYNSLTRMNATEFAQVLSHLAIPPQFFSRPTLSQHERALVLVRLVEQLGRVTDLHVAIGKVDKNVR